MAFERADIMKLSEVVEANLAGGWAGNTDAQTETWLVDTETRKNDVSWEDYMTWLSRHNGIVKLEAGKETGTTDLVKSASATALIVANAGQPLRLSDSEVRGFLGNLTPEIFTVAERNDLLAFSDETVARHVLYGVPFSIGAIDRARRWHTGG